MPLSPSSLYLAKISPLAVHASFFVRMLRKKAQILPLKACLCLTKQNLNNRWTFCRRKKRVCLVKLAQSTWSNEKLNWKPSPTYHPCLLVWHDGSRDPELWVTCPILSTQTCPWGKTWTKRPLNMLNSSEMLPFPIIIKSPKEIFNSDSLSYLIICCSRNNAVVEISVLPNSINITAISVRIFHQIRVSVLFSWQPITQLHSACRHWEIHLTPKVSQSTQTHLLICPSPHASAQDSSLISYFSSLKLGIILLFSPKSLYVLAIHRTSVSTPFKLHKHDSSLCAMLSLTAYVQITKQHLTALLKAKTQH